MLASHLVVDTLPTMDMRDVLLKELGYVPGAIAVMGKWEPVLSMEACLRMVAGRAAAALAVSEAMAPQGPGPYLLSAEGHLRGQPRPGCLMAAGILAQLGARHERIKLWPAADATVNEVWCFWRMAQALGAQGLLFITHPYHEARARRVLARVLPDEPRLVIRGITSPLIRQALDLLPPTRRAELEQTITAGQVRGFEHLPVAFTEGISALVGRAPRLENLLVEMFRGTSPRREEEMFPELPEDL